MFSKQFNLTEASDAHGNLQSLGKIVPIGWQVVAWGCWLSLAEVSQKEDAHGFLYSSNSSLYSVIFTNSSKQK